MWTRLPVHLRTFLFLGPFFVTLVLGRWLELDDNLMAAPRAGKRDGAAFNLVMVIMLWAGIVSFFVHMIRHADVSASWLLIKFATLVMIIGGMILLSER